jgi:hypothetical protein
MRLGWDSARPPGTRGLLIILLIAAHLTGVGIAAYRYEEVWTALQRRYLSSYVRGAVAFTTTGEYDLLDLVEKTGSRLALDDEVVTVTSATGETSFALSAAAVTAGATDLVWERKPYSHAALHAFLGRWIYRDQSLLELAAPALYGAFALFLGGLLGARAQDVVRARSWRSPYRPSEADWAMGSPVIDCVDCAPRSRAPSIAVTDRSSEQARLPGPGRLPGRSTHVLAAGDATRSLGSQDAPPGWWADPSFK